MPSVDSLLDAFDNFRIIPFRWKLRRYQASDKALGADGAVEAYKQYRHSMGVDDARLPTAAPFDAYQSEKLQNVAGAGFSTVMVAGKSLDATLTSSAHNIQAQAVKDQVATALKPTASTTEAGQVFKLGVEEIKKRFNSTAERFTPAHGVKYLQALTSDTKSSIDLQHTAEKDNLNTLFDKKSDGSDSDFVAQLKISCGLTNDAAVTNLKNDMIKAMEEAHKAELKKFEDSMKAFVVNMQKAVAISLSRIHVLNVLYAKNKVDIEKLRKERKQRIATGVVVSQEKPTDSDYFKGIFIDSLNTFKTNSGLDMTYDTSTGFYINFPHRFNPFKLFYYPNGLKNDFLTMMLALKATGKTATTIRWDMPDNPEQALNCARVAFEATLEAGFDDTVEEEVPDGKGGTTKKPQITILVNGKQTSVAELYNTGELQERLQAARLRASSDKKIKTTAAEDIMRADTHEVNRTFKADYADMMAGLKATASAAPPVPGAPASAHGAPASAHGAPPPGGPPVVI